MIRTYYELAKPGIIYGNTLTAGAGFFLAGQGVIEWSLLVVMLVGLSFIIASACVFNNYFDRHIDARMERTKNRALVVGHASKTGALLFGLALLLFGTLTLHYYTNILALGVALVGFLVYVFLYTPLKPHTAHALWVGAVAGATPPVVGYTAASGVLDVYAWILFAALFLWQIPHFLAIAVYRFEEYRAAGIPLFISKTPSPETKKKARAVFYASLVVLLLGCLALILQRWVR